jgi:hypothetical protein
LGGAPGSDGSGCFLPQPANTPKASISDKAPTAPRAILLLVVPTIGISSLDNILAVTHYIPIAGSGKGQTDNFLGLGSGQWIRPSCPATLFGHRRRAPGRPDTARFALYGPRCATILKGDYPVRTRSRGVSLPVDFPAGLIRE